MFNIKYQTFLSPIWKSFEFEFIAKSTDKTRSTLGKHCTTKKTKGNLNIFPCVGCIMGFTTYIYKLRCKDTNVKDSFIGHTTNPNTCKNYHKRRCNFSNGKLYQVMRDNGGWDNWKLNVLEKFEYIRITSNSKTRWRKKNSSTNQRWTDGRNRRSHQ